MFRYSTKRGRPLILFNCKSTYKMSKCKFLPLENQISTSTYLYGEVKVFCRVVARPRSVIVFIFDGRYNFFRTRRFTENSFAGLDEFQALFNSVKDEPFEFQSFYVAHLIARVALDTLGAREIIELYNSFSPISKGC